MSVDQPPAIDSTSAARGKVVVLGIFGVAILLAAFGWWWNLHQNQRIEQLWGHEPVRLIRQAPQVEFMELSPAAESDSPAETPGTDGKAYVASGVQDISEARGLVHARYALTEDASYEWPSPARGKEALQVRHFRWRLRFREGEKVATLDIDPTSRAVRLEPGAAEAIAIPRIISGWQRLTERESNAAAK